MRDKCDAELKGNKVTCSCQFREGECPEKLTEQECVNIIEWMTRKELENIITRRH